MPEAAPRPASAAPAGVPAWLTLAGGLFFGVVGCMLLLRFGLGWSGPMAGDAAGGPPGGGAGGPPPATVNTGVVEVQTLRERVSLVGRLQEVRRVTVTAEVEGRIVALAVRAGDTVTGGATAIASIDRVWADLALRSAQAELAAAEAELAQARSNLDQLERLSKANSAKDKEVNDQRTLVAERSARVDQLAADRDRAAVALERTDVVAPFDGAVSRTLVEVGRWVTPGDGVAEVVSTGAVDAVVDAPESVVNRLQRDADVEVVVDALNEAGAARLTGRIVSVRPDGYAASRSFPVKVRLRDPEGRLKPGMSVTANLPVSAEAEHVTVPRSAVLFGPAGAAVWYAMQAGGGRRAGWPGRARCACPIPPRAAGIYGDERTRAGALRRGRPLRGAAAARGALPGPDPRHPGGDRGRRAAVPDPAADVVAMTCLPAAHPCASEPSLRSSADMGGAEARRKAGRARFFSPRLRASAYSADERSDGLIGPRTDRGAQWT